VGGRFPKGITKGRISDSRKKVSGVIGPLDSVEVCQPDAADALAPRGKPASFGRPPGCQRLQSAQSEAVGLPV